MSGYCQTALFDIVSLIGISVPPTVFLPIISDIIARESINNVDPPIPNRTEAPYTSKRAFPEKRGK